MFGEKQIYFPQIWDRRIKAPEPLVAPLFGSAKFCTLKPVGIGADLGFRRVLPVALTRGEHKGLAVPHPVLQVCVTRLLRWQEHNLRSSRNSRLWPRPHESPTPALWPRPSRPHSSGRTCATPGRRRREGRTGPALGLWDIGLREPTGASRRDWRGRVASGRVVGDQPRGPAAAGAVAGARLGLGLRAPVRAAPAAAVMWCLHCNSERTQSLLELELDSG